MLVREPNENNKVKQIERPALTAIKCFRRTAKLNSRDSLGAQWHETYNVEPKLSCCNSAGQLQAFLLNSTKQPNVLVRGVRLKFRGHDNGHQRTEPRFNPPRPTLIRPALWNVSSSSCIESEIGHMSRRLLDALPANILTFICIPADFSTSGGCDPSPGGLVRLATPPTPEINMSFCFPPSWRPALVS